MKTIKEYLAEQKEKRSTELEDLAARVTALEQKNNESEDEAELKAAGEELDELNAKKAELEAELAEINAQIAELDKEEEKAAEEEKNETPKRNKLNFMTKESRGIKTMTYEERNENAKKFAETRRASYGAEETRAVLVSSGTIATPTEVDGINENGFASVSSIIDLVKVVNCEGMGKNRIAYTKTDAAAAAQTEGGAVGGTGTTFGFVDISPESIAILDSISKQTKKQSPLQYEAKVKEKAMLALRKEAARIVTEKVLASTLVATQTVTALDQNAIRDIVLNYGGDEGVEGAAYLFLNKADLITLGKVRGSNEKKAVFEIVPDENPNTGTIKDGGTIVKYCLNKNLTAGTLLYGQPKNIELDLFSNYEIAVSEDFYFDKLMDAIRGDVELGAEVVAQHGIVKVTVG
jgi:HK97 family phage major capsid protein